MKTDYSQGKIYKLVPLVKHEPHEIYISYTSYSHLSKAMAIIRSTYDSYKKGKQTNFKTQYTLFDKYGIDNIDIILVENVNANTKDELRARHAYHVETTDCINKNYIITKDKERDEIKEKIINELGHLDFNIMLAEYKKLKVKCPCGTEISKGSLSSHRKTKLHKTNIEKIKEIENKEDEQILNPQ